MHIYQYICQNNIYAKAEQYNEYFRLYSVKTYIQLEQKKTTKNNTLYTVH